MIICHSRQFIFIKTRKTASSSFELALQPYLRAGDVWTPLTTPRPRVAGNRHYSAWPIDVLTAKKKWFRQHIGLESTLHFRFFHDHIGAARLRRLVPRGVWNSYYKFCFERNPWDYLVSYYFFETRKDGERFGDFERFVLEADYPINSELYCENGRVAVDRVFKYEELERSAAFLFAKFGLPPPSLPRDKGNIRPEPGYRQFYTRKSRDCVAAKFGISINLLGYAF